MQHSLSITCAVLYSDRVLFVDCPRCSVKCCVSSMMLESVSRFHDAASSMSRTNEFSATMPAMQLFDMRRCASWGKRGIASMRVMSLCDGLTCLSASRSESGAELIVRCMRIHEPSQISERVHAAELVTRHVRELELDHARQAAGGHGSTVAQIDTCELAQISQ